MPLTDMIEQAILRRFHRLRTKEFGAGTTLALGWRGDESQLVRFGMLQGIGDMNGCSVLDAGCGYGDLRGYLHPIYPQLRYTGIDMMEEFIAVANTRYTHLPDTAFYVGNFRTANLPQSDYVLASGSLNYRSISPHFIYDAITRLFNACNIAFGFNLLSRVDSPDPLLATYGTETIMKHCHALTNKVTLHEGYFGTDYTVWMYK